MRAAGRKEDYITARALQVQAQELREKEILRLGYAKERAANTEDFVLAKSIKLEQEQLQRDSQRVIALEENAHKEATSPRRANVDRVGSRTRLEREDDPVFETVKPHDTPGEEIDHAADDWEREPDNEAEGSGDSEETEDSGEQDEADGGSEL